MTPTLEKPAVVFSDNQLQEAQSIPDNSHLIISEAGQIFTLRRKEFQLLHFLYNNKNRIITKHALLELIWHMDIYINSNTLEVHLSSLRRRLEEEKSPLIIETIRGVGYRLIERSATQNQTSIFDF